MKIILTINAGSSSLKFSVWENNERRLQGQIEQIGGYARYTLGRRTMAVRVPTVAAAIALMRHSLTAHGITPTVIAHRIVHGGGWFDRPTKLTTTVLNRLSSIVQLAPLHLPVNIAAVKLTQRAWPKSQAWGVFDTGPYHTLPPAAQLYSLPLAISKKFKIRKYGFHGTSHAWALQQTAKQLRRPARSCNAVSLHLGAGTSMTLWKNGRTIDTSMGFTPLAGVTMMTRTGDLDPMIPLYLQAVGGWTTGEVATMLNHQSGVLGLTGLRDMRDVMQAAGYRVTGWPRRGWSKSQRQRAKLGLGIYLYHLQRYLSSYSGLLPRLDAIIFTGAIGQNRTIQRLILDGVYNRRSAKVVTIPTDEEQAIAVAVQRMVK